MIKFFRKIRQNLLIENKTGKYLKYAIGEIVLVVIGFLIALSINNWNEEKKEKKELNQYLSSLKENIKEDIQVLDSLIKRRELIINRSKKEQLNFLNKTFNFDDTRWALSSYVDFYLQPNTSAYDALKNSPYLGKLNGTDLNNLIIDYYAKTYQIKEAEKSYNEFLENLEAKQAYDIDRTLVMAYIWMDTEQLKSTKTTQEEIENVFKKMHHSVAFRNIVSQAVNQEKGILVPYKEAKLIGLNIISEIDKIVEAK
ncbi:hypothetical protein SAMN06265375_105123 [Muriicola jejuensis]|uniref:Uncharacterized protein n=1 Tax=Muriicola jejuensis TaxID=504488 RepID=A0A6P0UED0_9FLAO|nr:DUF6090 family protein [Muriicola jejuensis]NER11631.1 hypothetical protein [Muriicola jejuensis]SMP25802.1 hypothetical protein SAMN06265375_105123 [Muriicola jejuensis]